MNDIGYCPTCERQWRRLSSGTICPYCDVLLVDERVSRTANGGSLERVVSRTDSELLNELQSLPYALELVYKRGTPKADSVPSLRDQINHFLEQEKSAAANDRTERSAGNAGRSQPKESNGL